VFATGCLDNVLIPYNQVLGRRQPMILLREVLKSSLPAEIWRKGRKLVVGT